MGSVIRYLGITSGMVFVYFQGGVNTSVKQGGIFVKSLAENGAAELDRRVHVGKLPMSAGVACDGVDRIGED